VHLLYKPMVYLVLSLAMPVDCSFPAVLIYRYLSGCLDMVYLLDMQHLKHPSNDR
jgi:hypothetical protein